MESIFNKVAAFLNMSSFIGLFEHFAKRIKSLVMIYWRLEEHIYLAEYLFHGCFQSMFQIFWTMRRNIVTQAFLKKTWFVNLVLLVNKLAKLLIKLMNHDIDDVG